MKTITRYILTYGYNGLNDGETIFITMDEAREAFIEYTGHTPEEINENYSLLGEEHDGTRLDELSIELTAQEIELIRKGDC